jgi:Protein of unknown function (DUF1566)
MRHLLPILVLTAGLLPFTTAQAAPADLPETGQTLCYDTANVAIACAGTGQDGDPKAGMAWPSPRFVAGPTTDCVTDALTGLVWVRAPVYASYTWDQAFTYANGLTLCGFSDWRLPNINELKSLLNSAAASTATFLNTQGFSNVQAAPYWSSTTSAVNSAIAWCVNLGDVRVDPSDKTVAGAFAWPVRAGQ